MSLSWKKKKKKKERFEFRLFIEGARRATETPCGLAGARGHPPCWRPLVLYSINFLDYLNKQKNKPKRSSSCDGSTLNPDQPTHLAINGETPACPLSTTNTESARRLFIWQTRPVFLFDGNWKFKLRFFSRFNILARSNIDVLNTIRTQILRLFVKTVGISHIMLLLCSCYWRTSRFLSAAIGVRNV